MIDRPIELALERGRYRLVRDEGRRVLLLRRGDLKDSLSYWRPIEGRELQSLLAMGLVCGHIPDLLPRELSLETTHPPVKLGTRRIHVRRGFLSLSGGPSKREGPNYESWQRLKFHREVPLREGEKVYTEAPVGVDSLFDWLEDREAGRLVTDFLPGVFL